MVTKVYPQQLILNQADRLVLWLPFHFGDQVECLPDHIQSHYDTNDWLY